MFLLVPLALITLIAGISQFVAYHRMYRYVLQELAKPVSGYCPKVAVILPCKGLDAGFKENVKKLVAQNYLKKNTVESKNDPSSFNNKNFEVIFAVAAEEDPAYTVLKEVIAENPDLSARLVVAGINSRRAQKLNNQLAALKEISSDVEVFVFVDSDVIARPDFLNRLVAPLQNKQIGIATGYRFYIPFQNTWPALIRSLWNRVTAWEMASKNFTFAWGGAMAISKTTFEQAQIAKEWDCSADDDLSMTTAVKRLGLSVRFVPQCLVASNGDASLSEIVEWTNRQLILTKVYYPALWRKAILRAAVLAFWLFGMLICGLELIFNQSQILVFAACIGLALLPIEVWFLIQSQGLWRRVLEEGTGEDQEDKTLKQAFEKTLWRFILVLPLAHILLPWLTLSSLLTNRIQWRGVTYELKSPNEVLVV